MQAQNMKTDRNDARGIAQMMRTGWFKEVHVKGEQSQKIRAVMSSRRCLLDKRLDLDNHIRATLRTFGLKVGAVSLTAFETRVLELIAGDGDLEACVAPLLEARRRIHERGWAAVTGQKTWGGAGRSAATTRPAFFAQLGLPLTASQGVADPDFK
jgi:transposase